MDTVKRTKFCKHCGAQIPLEATVCTTCGCVLETNVAPATGPSSYTPQNQVEIKTKFCKHCGAKVPFAAVVCTSCGRQLENYNSQPQVIINNASPVSQLKTNRGLAKYLLLSFLTLGIYSLVALAHISEETNIVCSRYDGKKTMNFWLLIFIVAPLTLSIAFFVWYHNLCNRIGNELARRGIDYKFGAADFWLWGVLGTLIVIGPFVFYHKLLKASNALNADFNAKG